MPNADEVLKSNAPRVRILDGDNNLLCPFCGYQARQIGMPIVSDTHDDFNISIPLGCKSEHSWLLNVCYAPDGSGWGGDVLLEYGQLRDESTWVRIAMDDKGDE